MGGRGPPCYPDKQGVVVDWETVDRYYRTTRANAHATKGLDVVTVHLSTFCFRSIICAH